jgi:alpha-glucosidase (family GH31 glycosyl hydrolase)
MKSLAISILLLMLGQRANGQSHPGAFTGYGRRANAITVRADSSSIRFTFYHDDVLRVDFLPTTHTVPDSSFAVVRGPLPDLALSVAESDSTLTIASSRIRVLCRRRPLKCAYYDSSGRLLLTEGTEGGFTSEGASRSGTGERGTALDKRAQAYDSYNTQRGGYASPLPTMNINVPFLASTRGYGLFFDNTYPGRFDLGASDTTSFTYTATGGELTYYLIEGRTLAGQLRAYTWLTGRQPLPPRWAFGFIQSKNRYVNEAEARSIVQTVRQKLFPCDAIVLDLKWFENMGDLKWDRTAWPDPDRMMGDFLARGIKTILITEPYIVERSLNYRAAAERGYLAKDSLGRSYVLDKWWSCGGCNAGLLDLTNPQAQQWWWQKLPPFMGNHVAGLWTDLGEPERHPLDMRHYLGSASRVHNIFNLLWAKTIFEGYHQFRPGERVFNLTRSGFAGIQRYGVITWSGDVARSFEGLAVQLPMLLNMGISGLAYQNSDIGGYSRIPTTPELFIRWMEFGTFCPVTRAHGAGEVTGGSATEPWMFGPDAEEICRSYLRLRYRLLPYNYTLAHQDYETGIPLARPLIMRYPEDSTLFNESSSYLWGDAFLVSPVVHAGQRVKDVYLPKGSWVDFWSDSVFTGGKTIAVSAPLDRMPILVRSGSIIPMAPDMDYTDQRPLDTLFLGVYPSTGDSTNFTLYEDDGKSLAYQSGQFCVTSFSESVVSGEKKRTLQVHIGRSEGEFVGKLAHRTYIVQIHGIEGKPTVVKVNGSRLAAADRYQSIFDRAAGYYYDRVTARVSIQVHGMTDRAYALTLEYPKGRESRAR